MLPTQEHADQASAPGGVRAAQLQGFVDKPLELERVRVGPAWIRSGERVLPVNPDASPQMTHGPADEAQGPRDRRDALTLFGPLHNHLAQRQRSRMWHEQSSLENVVNLDAHGTLSTLSSCGKTS